VTITFDEHLVSVVGRNVRVPLEREQIMVKRTLIAAAAAALALGGIVTAAPAGAEPRCGVQGGADCYGAPHYNGPLQNTWSHGLTQDPQICDDGNTFEPCGFYVPQP
jgi:hypothetical protein